MWQVNRTHGRSSGSHSDPRRKKENSAASSITAPRLPQKLLLPVDPHLHTLASPPPPPKNESSWPPQSCGAPGGFWNVSSPPYFLSESEVTNETKDCTITKTARLLGFRRERDAIEYLWKRRSEKDNFRFSSIAESTCSRSCVDLHLPLSPPDTPIEMESTNLTSYFGVGRTSTETLAAHEAVPHLYNPEGHRDDLPVELQDTSLRRVPRMNTTIQDLNTAVYELSCNPVPQKAAHSGCLPGATILDGNSNEHKRSTSDIELECRNIGSIEHSEGSPPRAIELLPNFAYRRPRTRRQVPSPAPSAVVNLATSVRGHGLRKVRALDDMKITADLYGSTKPETLHGILSPLNEFEQRQKRSFTSTGGQRLAAEKPQQSMASHSSSITSHTTAPLAGRSVEDARLPPNEQRGRRKRAVLTARTAPQKSLAVRCSSKSSQSPSKVYDNSEESPSKSIPITTFTNPTYDDLRPSSDEHRQIGGPIGSEREEIRWEEITEPEDLQLCLAVMRKELERKRKEIRETLPGSP